MKKNIIILLALILLSGCLPKTPPLQRNVADDLKKCKSVVSMNFLKKEIIYRELVYKVLYNESREQKANFSGVWDIDRDLTKLLSDEMNKKQLSTTSVFDVLSSEDYKDFEEAVSDNDFENYDINKKIVFKENIIEKLKLSHVDYVILVKSSRFSMMETTSFNSAGTFFIPSRLIIYNVNTQKQEYDEYISMSSRIEYGDSPRNLELNGLALLKDVGRSSVKSFVQRAGPEIFFIQ